MLLLSLLLWWWWWCLIGRFTIRVVDDEVTMAVHLGDHGNISIYPKDHGVGKESIKRSLFFFFCV